MTKVGLGHGMVRSLQNYASPLIIFVMTEVAIDVPNKRYYIEKLQTLMQKHKCYRLTHRKKQKIEM